MSGPCSPWVTLGEVQADPRAVKADGTPLADVLLADTIDLASEILYAASGRQFAGVCTDVVRPTRRWYRGDFPAWWQYQWGRSIPYTTRSPHRYQGAAPLTEITLGAYPIRDILEVRIDGAVYPSVNYRVDDRRWLVNIDPTGVGWPGWQDMDKDPATDANTFQVSFEWGQSPPVGGVLAAKTYAIELAKGMCGDPCALPERVLSLQMQGVSYTLLDPLAFLDKKRTGVYSIDVWLASVNPAGLNRRSAVLSPDFPRPVRRAGTVPGS